MSQMPENRPHTKLSPDPPVGRFLIYGLLDPRDQALRYIGKTHKRREIRLSEHIEDAQNGSQRPVHRWVREVIEAGRQPEIFVWRRIPPDKDWGEAERAAIRKWRCFAGPFPYIHPPQTPKSKTVEIWAVDLTNVSAGG